MDRILVAYGTKHGSTAEIAEAIAAALRPDGFDVDVKRAREVRRFDGYGGVVLGSAVYMGRWRPDAIRLLRQRRGELAQREVWLFSSGPVGPDPTEPSADAERWTKPKRVQQLAAEIGARDHVVFGGRITEAGGFIRRNMAKNTPAELRDRRDWDAIAGWAHGIAAALTEDSPGPQASPPDTPGSPARDDAP